MIKRSEILPCAGKEIILIISSISIIFLISGCSSKYQTNKLPNEEQVVVPKEYKDSRYYLNDELREDFKKYVIEEFNGGIENPNTTIIKTTNKNTKEDTNLHDSNSVLPRNIWTNGYEIDRKRY